MALNKIESKQAVINGVIADTSTLDYIAWRTYQATCVRGGTNPLHWLVLNDDIRREYLERAREMYVDWVTTEREAQAGRTTL